MTGLVVFPTFFLLILNLAIRSSWFESVISRSCFCWLYRASPSLAEKNIINLILVLSIWGCPCVELCLVLLEEGVCYDQCIFLEKLYSFLPCFIPHSKAKFACYSRWILTSYFCITVPYNEKDKIFWDCIQVLHFRLLLTMMAIPLLLRNSRPQ